MNLDNERKAFEQFCIKDDEFCIHRYDGDPNYSDDYTQCAWLAWLASSNREGYKLVPLEPTERMLDSAYSSISDNLHYADLENIYTAMINSCDNN